MNWNSVSDFLTMGGYAGYVWGAVGVSLAVLAMEVTLLRRRKQSAERRAGGKPRRI